MNHIDFTNLGGMPVTQTRLDFLQQSYLTAFGALAKLCGDKTILHGVDVAGGVVSDGWISYNGELLPFIGGAAATKVIIVETTTPFTFADTVVHDVHFDRYATLGSVGGFDFTDLTKLVSLKNIWKPGDLRQCVKDAAYEAANFDAGTGIGINEEVGWQIFSKYNTDAAGKVLVNKNDADTDFDTVGNFGGEKTHSLSDAEQGAFTVAVKSDDGFGTSGGGYTGNVRERFNGVEPPLGTANAGAFGADLTVQLDNSADAHNNLQPYFVVLTLIKL